MSDVLSEHWSYLTLPGRSALYARAIAQIIKPGDVVADLGCGVGVLGLQCLHAGAARIYGMDHSDAIHLAREVIERAGLAERYICIAQSTFDAQLPERVDVLICDHIGYFGIDYGIVKMMRDAKERMLKPDGRMMPDRLRLKAAAVSSDRCREWVEAWSADDVPQELHWLSDHARNAKRAYDFSADELCSPSCDLGDVDLLDDQPDLYSLSGHLDITKAGRFDGLAGWFDAHLGGNVWMTNSPVESRGIKRSQVFLPAAQTFEVKPGDRVGIKVKARFEGDPISWVIEPPGNQPRQTLSTWSSRIVDPAQLRQDMKP